MSPSKKQSALRIPASAVLLLSALSGAALGLSAPGIEQWYMAWFGLAPLLLLVASSSGIKQAFARAFVFGTAYNLVYLNWYLQLHPLYWLGYNWLESVSLSVVAWLLVSMHQGLIIGLFGAVARLLPTCGGFMPRIVDGRLSLPAALLIPLLWVLIENKLGNAHDFLGVPWSMVEYSQYRQMPMVQMAAWAGGIGIGALIMLFNTTLAGLIANITQRLSFKSLAASTLSAAFIQTLTVALVVAGAVAWGYSRLGAHTLPNETVSVLQGNINIDMEKRKHVWSLTDLEEHYAKLLVKAPPGLCIWTESALPAYLKEERQLIADLGRVSKESSHEMVVGSLDKDFDGRPYNSAYAVDAGGRLIDAVYHKRYLVPFGEYMPGFAHYLPAWIQKLTNTPAGQGFNAGKRPVVLDLAAGPVAPLICFETLSPELVVSSVRNGGKLLVNLSDLAWFHDSMCGDQMVAFSVMRAVETDRYFVFAANTGPSAIIDGQGRILKRSPSEKPLVLTGKVHFSSGTTPFTEWFSLLPI